MRNELQNIEAIERYLMNQMNAEEQAAFETQMAANQNLREQVQNQKLLQKAVSRAALRKEIQTVASVGGFFSGSGKWWLGGVMGALFLASSIFWIVSNTKGKELKEKEEERIEIGIKEKGEALEQQDVQVDSIFSTFYTEDEVEMGAVGAEKTLMNVPIPIQDNPNIPVHRIDFKGLKTWVNPEVESFVIDPKESQVLEGEFGTLITVPANAFEDEQGKTVESKVKVNLVEALTLEQMVLYNLTTTADGKALQTGGMIHLSYESEGKEVFVKDSRPLYIQIPTDEVKPDMKVFEGETVNGKVNWKNPKDLKKYLITVPFEQLDFLPKGFESTMRNHLPVLTLNEVNKEQVDSVYYSLVFTGNNWDKDGKYNDPRLNSNEIRGAGRRNNIRLFSRKQGRETNTPDSLGDETYNTCGGCGIDPLTIQSIRSGDFSKTFIATKEFAERLRIIHLALNGQEVISMYIKNVARDLSYSDSIAATMVHTSLQNYFVEFHKEGLTNVKDAELYQLALSNYYKAAYARNKRQAEELRSLFSKGKEKELKQAREEYINAVKQRGSIFAGINTTISKLSMSLMTRQQTSSYSFSWSKGGWINIDAYLHLLSKGSEKVKIVVDGSVPNLQIYNYINTLDNLTELDLSNNISFFPVPKRGTAGASQMKSTFCVAIGKTGDQYYWSNEEYAPYDLVGDVNMSVEPCTIGYIRNQLKTFGVKNDVVKRFDEIEEEKAKRKREEEELAKKLADAKKEYEVATAKWRKHQAMVEALRCVAFPCDGYIENVEKEVEEVSEFIER